MDGGVITIRFEADTTAVESSIKDLEKAASKSPFSGADAATQKILAEAAKISKEASKMRAEFDKMHPAIKETMAAVRQLKAEFEKDHPEIVAQREYNKQLEETRRLAQIAYNEQHAEEIKREQDLKKSAQEQKQRDNISRENQIKLRNEGKIALEDTKSNNKMIVDSNKESLQEQLADYKAEKAKEVDDHRAANKEKLNADKTANQEYILGVKDTFNKGFLAEKAALQDASNEYKSQLKDKEVSHKATEDRITADYKSHLKERELGTKHAFNMEKEDRRDARLQETLAQRERERLTKERNLDLKEERQNTTSLIAKYYLLSQAIRQVLDVCRALKQTVKNTFDMLVKFESTMFKVFTPLEQLSKKFLKSSGLGNKIKQLFSFSSISNFAKSAIEAASDLTEVQNIVDTAFPTMAGKMNEWAEDSIRAFGLSEKSAKQYAATLGLMAQSAGLAEKASYTLGTGLTAVTADLASMYNMNAEAVYEKIRSGVIGGRTMAIAQLGINMSQANLQAYMESKGISEKYNSLDNATKTVIRYNYVLEQTRKIQGDFVKTQGTWANQTRILSENIIALKAALGEFLVSVLTPLLVRINGLLQLLTKAVNKIKEILPLLGIKLQKAAGSGNGASAGLEDLSDGLEDAGYAADEAGKKIAKLTDGPFSEMHKVGDDGTSIASKMKDIFGGDGLLEYESKYELPETLKQTETWLDRILKKLNFTELFAEFKRSLNEIKGWIEAIKKAWKAAWDNKGTQVLQSVINAATQVLGLINDISKAFRDMFNSGWGQKVFEEKLETAQKIAETVERIAKRLRQAWNSKSGIYGDVYEEDGYDDRGYKKYKKVYRELTWGEEIAQTFYKIQIAIEDTKQAFFEFIGNTFEKVDWEHILSLLDGVGKNFEEMLKAWQDWLKDPKNAERMAKIIENVAENVAKVVNSIIDFLSDTNNLDRVVTLLEFASKHLDKILWTVLAIKTAGPLFSSILSSIPTILTLSKLSKIGKTVETAKATQDVINSVGAATNAGETVAAGTKIGKLLMEGIKSAGWSLGITALFREELEQVKWGKVSKYVEEHFPKPEDCINKQDWINKVNAMNNEIVTQYGEAGEKYVLLMGDVSNRAGEVWSEYTKRWLKENKPDPKDYLNSEEYYQAVEDFKIKYNELTGQIYLDDELMKEYSKDWTDYAELCANGSITNIETRWNALVNKLSEWLDKLKSKLREVFNLQSKVESSSTFSGGSGAAWVKTSQIGNYASVKFTDNKTIKKHANGGVWAPNSPSLAILGDHPSQTEYALTEGHLDNIADRMASGIINGFARVSLAGAGGGTPNIYVQIGDREIKDLIVQTVNEENYRRF